MNELTKNNSRIEVVDALRGFAIATILILHNLEHFDYLRYPEFLPEWLKVMDNTLMNSLFFLFGGKSYSIFALLFGFTFFIQDSHQAAKGKDFRGRFAWRMLLLLGFSVINSMFFQGDILTLFAVLGLILIPVCRLKDSVVFTIMTILLLQPYELGSLIALAVNPDATYHMTNSSALFAEAYTHFPDTSFWGMIKSNLTCGKGAVLLWNLENGRLFHIPALFLAGFLIGRRHLFESSEKSLAFWKNAAIIGLAAFTVLFLTKASGVTFFNRAEMNVIMTKLLGFWANVCFTAFLIGLFFSLYHIGAWKNTLDFFTPIGKMSLTCYIFSSIWGFFLYYGCGLGLHRYTGATMCFFLGILLVFLFWLFCSSYGKNHKHGPLEHIWHKLTWINNK